MDFVLIVVHKVLQEWTPIVMAMYYLFDLDYLFGLLTWPIVLLYLMAEMKTYDLSQCEI